MRVSVSGKNINVGSALQEHVETALEAVVNKYFDKAIDAEVLFSKEGHLFCADILVNEGTGSGILIKGQAKADDVYPAFDLAAEKVEKQLRRYKRKLKNHHKKGEGDVSFEMFEAKKYVISENENEEEASEDDNPLIIAEKQTAIETLTVADAVMRMNLANLPAYVFINKKTGGINMVYHRKDGNITWLDCDQKNAAANAA